MSYQPAISRREALRRLSVLATALPMAGCVYPQPQLPETNPWPDISPPGDAMGYGTDPLLITPQPAPWPLILSQPQLHTVASLAEVFCPGAAEAGVVEVMNEWLSAPYPDQQRDHQLVVPGLIWLDEQSRALYSKTFRSMDVSSQIALLDRYLDVDDEASSSSRPTLFLNRLRVLITGAYFSSPAGVAELGYVGNRPVQGDYPGPDPAAMDHLNDLLDDLGLQLPDESNLRRRYTD